MPEAKDDLKREKVRIVPISNIEDFPDHPFQVKDDESMDQLVESIRMNGVLNPVIALKIDENHYQLISGHLYTLDEKFTAGVKMSLGKGALDACTLFLKNEYKGITLTGEQRTTVVTTRNPQKALLAVAKYAEKLYGVGTNKSENKTRLQAAGYVFSDDIIRHTYSGETATFEFSTSDMNAVAFSEKLNTHTHGRDYHSKVGKIGLEIGMEYSYMNTVIAYRLMNQSMIVTKVVNAFGLFCPILFEALIPKLKSCLCADICILNLYV